MCTWVDECLLKSWVVLDSALHLNFDTNLTKPGLGLNGSSLGCSSLGVTVPFLLPGLKSSLKTRSRSLANGASCAIKVQELLTLLRTINAVVPDRHFFFFLTPPHPPLLLSLLTSLIWNPSRNSGRRGRTHQLVMYSQCREKLVGCLSNVWNTPVEFSGARFCSLVESFMNHSTRILLASVQLTTPFPSKLPAACCCFCCQSSSAGSLIGVLSYSWDKP